MRRCLSLLLTASLLATSSFCGAASMTLRPVADTGLFENRPDNNLGAMAFMPVGTILQGPMQNRGLITFDIAGNIPSGAEITSVSLRIMVVVSPSIASPAFDLHRMLVSWNEGNKTGDPFLGNVGAPAGEGEPTWNNRAAPSTPWGAPGGHAGTDFVTTASASQTFGFTGLPTASTFASATLIADVQGWLDNPASNFGWLLKAQNEAPLGTARRVGSREDSVNAPELTVEFVLPPRIQDVTISGGEFRFRFRASPGSTYEVQRRAQFGAGVWTTITNINPQGVETDILIADPTGPGEQFYQVVIP